MGSSSSVLSYDVTTLVTRNGVMDADPVAFAYRRDDPYAVSLTVASGDAKVEWVFARDLLRDGMSHSVGEGEVAISSDAGAVVVEMRAGDNHFRLECARQGVESFVESVFDMVPQGAETTGLDVDRMLSELLR